MHLSFSKKASLISRLFFVRFFNDFDYLKQFFIKINISFLICENVYKCILHINFSLDL